MAQTIQIRRGTGSAVPSSLAAGELAINTDTGKFYYGNGSAVSSDFRVDSITAESYTISSSVTSYTFQSFSGSTDFGDDVADIHKRTGSLNVSGSVTVNGALTATDVIITDDLTLTDDVNINATGRIYLTGAGGNEYITSPTTGIVELAAGLKVLVSDPLHVNTNITASGNISASGEIEANTFKASGNVDFNGDLDVDGTTNLDTVDIDGTTNFGGTVSLGTNGAGVSQYFYSDTAGKFAYWSDGYNMFNFSDHTYLSFGTVTGPGTGDMRFYYNGSRLVLEDYIGDNILHISSSDTAQLIVDGHITASGNIQIGNDAEINSIGSMVFRVDSDASEAGQTFTFRHDASTDIAELDEGGNLILYGNQLGQPSIKLQQNTQTATFGPPVFLFERVDVSSDNADIGRFDFKADDLSGNLTTYAQIIGRTEESQNGSEGGQLELKIASHDAELVTALKLEDGDAEDEVDVTIANGTDSLTTVAGNLTANGTATASTGSFDVMTKALHMIPFAYFVSSTHTSELFIPVAGSLSESAFDQYYHMFHAPYNGTVKRIALSWQSGTPGDSTIRVRKASNFDPDDSGDIVETVVISSAVQDTMYYADFSASFSKGDVVAFTVQQSGTDNSYIGGTIAMEFDTSS
jgi:hypothetical protein